MKIYTLFGIGGNALGFGGGSGSGGSGSVTNSGTLTNNAAAFGAGTTVVKVDPNVTTDMSGNLITTGSVTAASFITSGTAAGSITLKEASAAGSNAIVMTAPAGAFSNFTMVVPSADGTAGQVWTTDGAGNQTLGAFGLNATPLTTRGDLLIVNSTPALARLAIATTGKYPKSNGTDIVYSTLAASGVGACGAGTWASTLTGDTAPTCSTPTLDQIASPAAAKVFVLGNANFLTLGDSTSSATSTNNLLTVTDGANNTGTGAVVKVVSASGSLAPVAQFTFTGAATTAVATMFSTTVTGAPTTNAGGAGLAGASHSFTSQAGGASSNAAATGGAGGGFTFVTGAGGTATGAAANANGGDFTITLGAAGTGGAGAAGRVGQLIMNGTWATSAGGATIQPLSGQNINLTNGTGGITRITGGSTAANHLLIVKAGNATPTGDMVQLQNSSGTALGGIFHGGTIGVALTQWLTADGTIAAGDVVKVTGASADNRVLTVALTDTIDYIGIAQAASTAGNPIEIAVAGVTVKPLVDAGTCTRGDQVLVATATTAGRVKCAAPGTAITAGQVIGKALSTQASIGSAVTVLIQPR